MTTTTMTRKTYALLVLGLLLVPLPGVLLASTRGQSGTLPQDFITVEVEVYKNNELWLRDYADPVNAYWLATMIGSLFFSAIKYIYGYYSIDGYYLVNGVPMTTAETLTLGGVNASNITNYGWISIYPSSLVPLAIASDTELAPGLGTGETTYFTSDRDYVLQMFLSNYYVYWCSFNSGGYIPVIFLSNDVLYDILSNPFVPVSSLISEPIVLMPYTFPYGSQVSSNHHISVVIPIGLLETWLSIYLADSVASIIEYNLTSTICSDYVSFIYNTFKEFKGPIVALIGYSPQTSSADIDKVIGQSILYPSLGIIRGLPSITYPGGLGFPGIGVPVQGGGENPSYPSSIIAQKGPDINRYIIQDNNSVKLSIEWQPYLPQIRDNRMAYIYDVAGMIISNFVAKYYPEEIEEAQNLYSLPYSSFALNTTRMSLRYDEIHHSYIVEIEASGRLSNKYAEYTVFALELLSPYLLVGAGLLAQDYVMLTNIPPVAIDFPNRYLVLYPGDEVKVIYRIKIRQDWPWTRNFYSYLINYGIGAKWYYIAHNESLPTLLEFIDDKGHYHDSLFNITREELPIPIPVIELSSESVTSQTFDTYIAYTLPSSLGRFESPAATLVLYKNGDLIRIAATLGLEVSNITKATELAKSIGVYLYPYSDTSFLFAVIPIQYIKLVSESSRAIHSNQYLYAMTIWLGVDLGGEG